MLAVLLGEMKTRSSHVASRKRVNRLRPRPRKHNYIELDDGHNKVAILTGGLPYHRDARAAARWDSLLIVRGESQRRFRLGIGVELAHPVHRGDGFTFAAPPSDEYR